MPCTGWPNVSGPFASQSFGSNLASYKLTEENLWSGLLIFTKYNEAKHRVKKTPTWSTLNFLFSKVFGVSFTEKYEIIDGTQCHGLHRHLLRLVITWQCAHTRSQCAHYSVHVTACTEAFSRRIITWRSLGAPGASPLIAAVIGFRFWTLVGSLYPL